MRRCTWIAVLLLASLSLAGCRRPGGQRTVTIVTTPEVAGNGVAVMLAERFTRETQVPVSVLVTEERLVMPMVTKKLVDAVITTSPDLQRAIQQSGAARLANRFAFDDYLIAGPRRDRARVASAKTATAALQQIVRRDRPFCSPVDVSELRDREAKLWAASGVKAEDDRRYRRCAGSAEEVLRESDRRDAYTITDRATFARTRRLALVPLLERTPLLHDDYSITLVERGGKHRKNGEWFVQWVMSFRGREAIEAYRFDSERRLFVAEP